jgi:Sugar phosphate permease
VLRVCFVKAALGVGDYGLISWLPTLMQRRYGLTALEAGTMIAAAITASGLAASLIGGSMSDMIAKRWGASTRAIALLPCYMITFAGAILTLLAKNSSIVTVAFGLGALQPERNDGARFLGDGCDPS